MNTLDKLKELQAAATPGPWKVNPDGAEEWWYTDTILGEGGAGGAVASCTKGNAPLVVTAINALPALIEVAEAAKWVRETTNHAYVLNQAAVKGALKRLDAALAKLTEEV